MTLDPTDVLRSRDFRVVAFDWDGTAVADRRSDASATREAIDELLQTGTTLAVITGTRFENIDTPLCDARRGPHRRHLHVSTNRGSEVFGYDPSGEPLLLYRRVATPEEDRRLDRIADRVRDAIVAGTGLVVAVVRDRMNRRKIDLIPEPAWRDPPKERIGELLAAVEARLARGGWTGGVGAVMALAEAVAREEGLADARVTSDAKHVEVGLTDKSDAIAWVLRHLAGGDPTRVLVVGDEFGPIGGIEGSDARMSIPAMRGATFVSVGPEPEGAPPEVLHVGGGPARFRGILSALAKRRLGEPVRPSLCTPTDPAWMLVEEGFVVDREHEIESCFAVSNGAVGVRGAVGEGSPLSRPATYLAGVYEWHADVPVLATAPEWTRLWVLVDGVALAVGTGGDLEHRRTLDLEQGILWRQWRHTDPNGRVTRMRTRRLASLVDRRVIAEMTEIVAENWQGRLVLEAHVRCPAGWKVGTGGTNGPVLFLHGGQVAGEADEPEQPTIEAREGGQVLRWDVEARPGRRYRLDRLCAVQHLGQERAPCVEQIAQRTLVYGLDDDAADHAASWRGRWAASDVVLEGDDALQRALRFGVYHLVGAANPDNRRVSVPARALTGPAYLGHVFCDTEICLLPFYALTWPRAARAVLGYRHHCLPAARARAASFGWRGALFAWESAEDGVDVTPRVVVTPDGHVVRILCGEQENHVSAAVAWAAWRYWELTGDDLYVRDEGAEILLETARFWASRGRVEADGRFHIRGVMGPDEYHEGVDDNAYTNAMAQWNLARGVGVARMYARRWPERWEVLEAAIGLDRAEVEEWAAIVPKVHLSMDRATGVIEQFAGYFDLAEVDLSVYEARTAPMDVLIGRDALAASKVIKQADVVLLLHLLWDSFAPEVRLANFRYYEPRTGHGSSLSPPIHALVAARLGEDDLAERYFRQTAAIDLSDSMGNAAGGVHIGALGGLWQAAVFGYGGLSFNADGPSLEGRLPRFARRLAFTIEWRRQRWCAEITPAGATLAPWRPS